MSRIRNFCAALLMALLPFLSTPAGAVVNAMDPVPGATVLYPYFEVDLANANGATTLMSLVNSSATAILANVVVWSDWATPVHRFPIYLTGFDVATWNMRDILSGLRPATASAGQDPGDTISHHGSISQDINFASCTGTLPMTNLSAGEIADIQAALTGAPVSGANTMGITAGACVGKNYGDQLARGYVTVDLVTNCTTRTPADPTYYSSSDITFQNVAWGDFMQINPGTGTATGGLATMVESKLQFLPGLFVSGDYTFYGRFNGFNASDQREGLASRWIVQGDTDFTRVVAWRDPKTTTGITGATCGTTPGNQPLPTDYAHAVWMDSFATDVTATAAFASPVSKLLLTSTAPLSLPAAKKLGFLALGLDHATGAVPSGGPGVAQSMVTLYREPRTNGFLGSRAIAFPVQQVMTPSNGFGRVIP